MCARTASNVSGNVTPQHFTVSSGFDSDEWLGTFENPVPCLLIAILRNPLRFLACFLRVRSSCSCVVSRNPSVSPPSVSLPVTKLLQHFQPLLSSVLSPFPPSPLH